MAHVESGRPLLAVTDLKKHYPIRGSLLKRSRGSVRAVDGVSFAVKAGERFGLVGESGCGKTTLGRMIAGAHSATGGRITFEAQDGAPIEVTQLRGAALRRYLAQTQMVFQDPYSSLNPRRTVMQIVEEPMICLTDWDAERRKARVLRLLDDVGLDHRHAHRYPHAFSGGQRQRIGIARALAVGPRLLVCDEAVSALDVSIRGQIINLLRDLSAKLDLAIIFVSHDLGVVRHLCQRIAVMYAGRLVEIAASARLFEAPRHPYTEALLSAIPSVDPDATLRPIILDGDVADPGERPAGCSFHPRCRYAQDICRRKDPPLRAVGTEAHLVACHFAEDLHLRGNRMR